MLHKREHIYESEYDEVTGRPLPQSTDRQQEEAVVSAIYEAESLQNLSEHPGWKLIKAAMQHDLEQAHEGLLHSLNLDHTRGLQEFVKARRGLLSWIDSKIREGKEILAEQTQGSGETLNNLRRQ
jgi:hypothetical protein